MALMVTYTVVKHCTTSHYIANTANLINDKYYREAACDIALHHYVHARKKLATTNLLILVILILHTHWPKLSFVCTEKGRP